MKLLNSLRVFLRKFLKNLSVWYIERYGYHVTDKKSLYDWQINPDYKTRYNLETKIPKDAKDYLYPTNPKLIQLRKDYQKFLGNNFKKGLWTENYLGEKDLIYFKGDNPYVYQRRGNQQSQLAYLLTYFWLKSKHGKGLSSFNEEESFGVFKYTIDNKIISRDLLDSFNEILFLEEHFFYNYDTKVNILEIGAGYGRLAKWLTKNTNYIEHYYCIDAIPESTFISDYYLKHYNKIKEVTVVPIHQRKIFLENQNISLAVNIHSFSEMAIDFIKFWMEEVISLRIPYLFIVPNAGHLYRGDLISFDNKNFKNIIESNGYELVIKRDKYLEPNIQKYGLNPTMYYLYKNHKFVGINEKFGNSEII